mgnify:CR=1 FL=1
MENSMKITAGLGSIDEYERFVQAGADEFFCGYVPFSWAEKYGTVMPLNRREVLCCNVQLGAYSELEILSRMVKKYKKPVHLTFNSLYYLPEQYPEIGDIIEKCMGIGFRSYIIADPALLVYLKNRGISCEIHLSGETGEVNSEMLKMFRRFPLKRLIFTIATPSLIWAVFSFRTSVSFLMAFGRRVRFSPSRIVTVFGILLTSRLFTLLLERNTFFSSGIVCT